MIDFVDRMMQDIPSYDTKVEYIQPTVINTFSREKFEYFLTNLSRFNDNQIFDFIKTNLEYIQSCIMARDVLVINQFHDIRFVNAFFLVVSNMPVTVMRQFCVNKICYDYFTLDNANPDIKSILLNTAKKVNAEEIRQLMSIGLDVDTASNLAFCRFSSIDEKVNIKRLNFVICSKDPDIMTEQMIVWIYEKLFDRLGQLFVTTMLEYYVVDEDAEPDSPFMEIMSTIYLAILTMANNLPIVDIRRLLELYVQSWEHAGRPRVRVSLRSLSNDFGRIRQVVDDMITRYNIWIP